MQSCSTENRKTKRIQNLDEGVREGLALEGFSACWTPLWSDCSYQGLCLAWSDLDFSCKSQEVMATHVIELMAPVSAFTFRELLSLSSVSLVAFFLISGVHRQVQVPSRAKSWAQSFHVVSCTLPALLVPGHHRLCQEMGERRGRVSWAEAKRIET